jgi:hypothetical protein
MNEILLKYNLLDKLSQKQLLDYLNFLLGKQKKQARSFDIEGYRQKLLSVSVWQEEDIQNLKQVGKSFNWATEEW